GGERRRWAAAGTQQRRAEVSARHSFEIVDCPRNAALAGGDRLLHLVNAVPRSCGLERIVHIADVLYAFVLQPGAESGSALFGEDGDAIFPGGASAEHAIKLHARLGGKLQVFDELRIAHASRQIDEWLAGCASGSAIMVERFLLGVSLGALERSCALNELQVYRDLDLQHIHAVALLGELLH